MVTDVPGEPLVGLRLLMVGVSTVKATPLLCKPAYVVTTTLPVVAPLGTLTLMLVFVQLLIQLKGTLVPLKVTPPVLVPKLLPEMMTVAIGSALVGFRPVMLGGIRTVNVTPLLATNPAAVTMTFPVVAPVGTVAVMLVALQPLTVAVVPLNLTKPLPCDVPKLEPAMVTLEPTVPEFGLRLLMLGAAVTVNVTPLLCTNPAAVTMTFPVVAPVGTVAVMLVALQLLIVVADVPLKVTLPLP